MDLDYKKYNMLHFSVISDFNNEESFNGYKMLSASKGNVIIICGTLLSKMAIGFILTQEIATSKSLEAVECGLVQTKYLDKF